MAWLDSTARSIFLWEFVKSFALAMRYFFAPKATINYPFEEGRSLASLPRRACRSGAIPTAKRGALLASSAKRCAQHWRSLSRPSRAKTAAAAPRATTSTWSNASILRPSPGGPVRSTRSWKVRTSNSRRRPAKNCYYDKDRPAREWRSLGNRNCALIWNSTRPTARAVPRGSGRGHHAHRHRLLHLFSTDPHSERHPGG